MMFEVPAGRRLEFSAADGSVLDVPIAVLLTRQIDDRSKGTGRPSPA